CCERSIARRRTFLGHGSTRPPLRGGHGSGRALRERSSVWTRLFLGAADPAALRDADRVKRFHDVVAPVCLFLAARPGLRQRALRAVVAIRAAAKPLSAIRGS